MTTNPDVDVLAALEWREYACQCPTHREPCNNRATHVVRIHALHACNDPGLDSGGNRVEIRCFECLLRLQAEVGYRLTKASAWGLCACGSCGAPMATITDVVRGWEPLQ